MLEEYFKLPAVLRRHRSGLLGPHLDSFVSLSRSLGYPRDRSPPVLCYCISSVET